MAACGASENAGQTSTAAPVAETLDANQQANELFEKVFTEWVDRSPEFQTALGRSTNMDKWDDLSEAFALEGLDLDRKNLTALQAIDASQLDPATALSYELMEQNLQRSIDGFEWRLHNYPVNQMFGSHSNVPDLLINMHRVTNIEAAQAYVARLQAVPAYFKQVIDGLNRRADAGIIPPKFVFAHVIRDCRNVIKGAPFEVGKDSTLLADFKGKLEALQTAEENPLSEADANRLLLAASRALEKSVKPAYEALISALSELEARATIDDGIWKVPEGERFYEFALQRTTTTDMTAEEIHQLGLDEVARIHDEMRAIKDQVGYNGNLKSFMSFVRNADQFVYPNTPEGKARYLSEATALIETMKGRLDELFLRLPKADINVKAVEPFREQSAGKAFYQRPSEDGSRPGLYYANLYDMEAMPTYQMEALAYHEGVPGHHMQIAIAMELEGIPTFRKFVGYTAYTEGWGLYSEMVPKEIGFYSDPYSDFGRLAMELWRACRLVVDTGIHDKKWTRQQGIDYYVNNTPNAVSDAVKMVERHIVMPSQATAYKVGMLKIWQLREAAKQSLGDKFDIREFHDEVLKYGPVPLNVVQRNVEAWVASKGA
ncbi:MAG: DUF885 domain-containing protein [Gammaproteobacteria bacterium]|nr:DUF885 domain-containing protein [Gammaproteobacteria bacterium]